MTLNIGFIGFGKSTNRYHLPYVLLRKNLRVKTIYNRSRKPELESKYQQHDINFTDKPNELLQDDSIQLITICTPANTHFDFAKQCLLHNKHVLVEKPFCNTVDEARELLALANEKDLTIMPFQNRRFDSDFLALKDVLHHSRLGDPVEVESHFDYYRPEDPDKNGTSYDGAFYGLAVHLIDQITSLFGRPNNVYYDIRSIRNKNNPDDYFHIDLHYGKLKVIVKTNHLVLAPYPKWTLHGTKGSFIKYGIDQQETCLKAGIMPETDGFGQDSKDTYGKIHFIDNEDQEQTEIIPTPAGDYGRIYDHFYDCIVNSAEKLITDEQIITVLEILEKGISGENPKVVSLEHLNI